MARVTRENAQRMLAEVQAQLLRVREMQARNEALRKRLADANAWTISQAQGMVSAQAGVSLGEAMRLIDEYAAEHGYTQRGVAERVVDRSLRFD